MQKRIYWQKPSTRRHRLLFFINIALVLVLGGAVASGLTLFIGYHILSKDLPKLSTIADYSPNIISYVYDDSGKVVGEFKYENQRRILIDYDQIPQIVINSIVAAEDAAFWKHEGLDYMGMVRALIVNIKQGHWSQGGSTITQQVTRSLLLTKEKKLARKLKEMILAQRIEQKLRKEDILTLYLNEIYFGNGAYGIEAAAENYFEKNVKELTLSESALLAGLPQAPSRYSPYWNASAAKARQRYVIEQLLSEKLIAPIQAQKALAEPWNLKKPEDINLKYAPYFVEYVRQYVTKKYGADKVHKKGLKIYTTLDTKLQQAADVAMDVGLRKLDKRQGWRGPAKNLQPAQVKPYLETLASAQDWVPRKGEILKGVVVMVGKDSALVNVGGHTGRLNVKGARWINKIIKNKKLLPYRVKNLNDILRVNDVIEVKTTQGGKSPLFSLEQKPKTQAALLAMEPATRFLRAMVGGSDYKSSPFNRAFQAKRQPGSSFKPVVYAAALEAGMTPATVIMDTALVFKDGWRPGNYDGKFKGMMTLRQALTKSVNTITIRIVDRITVDYVYRFAHRLGIKSLAGADLSMALGTYEIPPVELINAYAVFASGGKLGDPIFIKRIETAEGFILEETILATEFTEAPPMENVPDVSNWGFEVEGEDLEQGAFENTTIADPVAKNQFYEDFNLNKDKKEKGLLLDSFKKPENKYTNKVYFKQVLSPQTCFLITSIMHSVATRGTGAKSNVIGKFVAGKTGTTNDYVDAWFIGFSPDILAGVWVGNDQGSAPIGRGETGSSAALPIWIEFMKEALKDLPNKDFPTVEGISVARIDPKTGLLARPTTKGAYDEYFKSGTEPIRYAPDESAPDPTNFFEMELE